jgi:sugar/nucleoside kinase (ribokinase family)
VDHPALDVVGLGANSIDEVTIVPALPVTRGEHAKMPIELHVISGGGQVLTAMATCASLGLRARYIGAVGNDDRGRLVRDLLRQRGLDAGGVVTREGASQFAIVLLDRSGERIVLWSRDARLAAVPLDVPDPVLRAVRLLHVDDVDPVSSLRATAAACALGLPVTSDIDRTSDDARALADAVTIPILAEHVPAAFTGESDPGTALARLHRPHHELVVVTLGARGALAFDGASLHYEAGFPVRAVDTTGSGDVFRGAFIYGRLHGWPVPRLLRFANAAAAVACTRLGALGGVPTLPEVEALLARGSSPEPVDVASPEDGLVS